MELWLVTSVVGIAKSVPQENTKFTFAIMQFWTHMVILAMISTFTQG